MVLGPQSQFSFVINLIWELNFPCSPPFECRRHTMTRMICYFDGSGHIPSFFPVPNFTAVILLPNLAPTIRLLMDGAGTCFRKTLLEH